MLASPGLSFEHGRDPFLKAIVLLGLGSHLHNYLTLIAMPRHSTLSLGTVALEVLREHNLLSSMRIPGVWVLMAVPAAAAVPDTGTC